ncbi:MAG: helix-turn-helix transcriptional regulator [Nostocaceae cyanobacterium]|nr:helix-turn-helix transcriptional regulator [Nostocaceae cyanobacterium]
MNKNSHQLMVTKSWVEKFQQAIVSLHENEDKKQKDAEEWQIIIDSYYAQIKNLQAQIAEYEYLLDHNPEKRLVLSATNVSLDEIGEVLIKVRIANKVTEKELAALTQLTEKQIKEYENKDYHNAKFEDILEVADALGIKFEHFVMASENNGFVRKEILKLRQQPGQLDADIKAVS